MKDIRSEQTKDDNIYAAAEAQLEEQVENLLKEKSSKPEGTPKLAAAKARP